VATIVAKSTRNRGSLGQVHRVEVAQDAIVKFAREVAIKVALATIAATVALLAEPRPIVDESRGTEQRVSCGEGANETTPGSCRRNLQRSVGKVGGQIVNG
jgi:hypothetical protein